MIQKLTWSDLVVGDFTPEEVSNWITSWSWLVQGRVTPLFLSRLGDWYLRHPDGSTQMHALLAAHLGGLFNTVGRGLLRLHMRARQGRRASIRPEDV